MVKLRPRVHRQEWTNAVCVSSSTYMILLHLGTFSWHIVSLLTYCHWAETEMEPGQGAWWQLGGSTIHTHHARHNITYKHACNRLLIHSCETVCVSPAQMWSVYINILSIALEAGKPSLVQLSHSKLCFFKIYSFLLWEGSCVPTRRTRALTVLVFCPQYHLQGEDGLGESKSFM